MLRRERESDRLGHDFDELDALARRVCHRSQPSTQFFVAHVFSPRAVRDSKGLGRRQPQRLGRPLVHRAPLDLLVDQALHKVENLLR
eukprot:4394876-Pleurochrysis_carterae.AAC.1